MIPLTKFPRVSLGLFPTPIIKSNKLDIFIKQDGLSGEIFGGNKIRKLEFLLADAIEKKKKKIVTYGAAGSNHALATAFYSKKLGLDPILVLSHQPNAKYVRRNLLFDLKIGAKLVYGQEYHFTDEYEIPMGGSNEIGALGFVNAVFELKEQMIPDVIYLALGSMSTTIGLMIGLKILKLSTKVIPVKITQTVSEERFIEMYNKIVELLGNPIEKINSANIREGFMGERYAQFTEKGTDAIKFMQNEIKLDGSYSGKAFSALIEDYNKGLLKGKKVLFWNTLNQRELDVSGLDYHDLPKEFHWYFEEPVQELDK